ncbi:MAG: ATP-dependent DNA ligase [Acidimicrobiia bacterium]|nr:ATP-dependent DNA ligase [Acidimicrobiia bacterium]
MLLLRLAETSAAVAATGSRKAKGELLASVLADLEPDEIEPTVGFLIGAPRQGALGVGWATVSRVEVIPASEASLVVGDLDRLLTAISRTSGPGSATARTRLLNDFLAKATEAEHDLVRRILIGDLRQGALAGVLTDALAKASGVTQKLLRRAVMLQGDLGRTAVIALTEGAEGLERVDLEVGRPIQPMLASTAADVSEAIEALGPVQVEWKLDGARIQVHVRRDAVAVYTRNLNDVTARLPQVVELARSLPCDDAVLDGEVVGFFGDYPGLDPIQDDNDGDTDRPRPFQETMSAFGTETDASPAPEGGRLRPFFFDLMFLDGESLIDRPLAERSDALADLVGRHGIPRITTDRVDEGERHLADALDAGHEGVMVKAVDGPYEAGRRGKSWRKVKPVHTLDLVVLAAEWGHGRRQGWLSNLHLGARDPDGDGFVMVGKTFKGLTDELLAWQTERFLELKTHESTTGHTVYIAPELVVEIALDGAQTSTRYAGGVALRFARVKGYRPDRSPETADTLDAVRALL